eukprot:GEMP01131480.1.p1 GENE.GEMP01131480.1~~GEMP01131480.1.p1  ORF type:complete len:110 (+),score=5.26 GEMP01131480.1:194-523(+)
MWRRGGLSATATLHASKRHLFRALPSLHARALPVPASAWHHYAMGSQKKTDIRKKSDLLFIIIVINITFTFRVLVVLVDFYVFYWIRAFVYFSFSITFRFVKNVSDREP